jgi:thioredoxin-like negative regulator of GroEL
MFEVGSLQTTEKDFPAALQTFKSAYELAPGFSQALTFYAAAAIQAGNMTLADSLLIPKYGSDTPNDPYILQAYIDVKNFPKVIAIAKARAEAEPTKVQWWVQLAAAYLQAGDKASAIATLQKAEEVDASFKAQGDQYIQQIKDGTLTQ